MSEHRETYDLCTGRLVRDAGVPTFDGDDDEPVTIRTGARPSIEAEGPEGDEDDDSGPPSDDEESECAADVPLFV